MNETDDKYLEEGKRPDVVDNSCCSGCGSRYGFNDLELPVLRTKVGSDIFFLCASRTYHGNRRGCGRDGHDDGYEKPTEQAVRDSKVLLHCPHFLTTDRSETVYEDVSIEEVPDRFLIEPDEFRRNDS
jgi:hypothetical protein